MTEQPPEVVPTLLLTGPVGVGKSSVLSEIVYLLGERGVPHAGVDLDALSEYSPRPTTDPFGTEVALRNLGAVCRNYREAGARRLVLATVILDEEGVRRVERAVPGATVTVCRLRASIPTLQRRVRARELGAGLDWHVARAAELGAMFEGLAVPHLVVDTEGRPVREIAAEVLREAGWISE